VGKDVSRDEELALLLSRTALADAVAFETLYRRVSPQLFATALRMLRRSDWAEDVLQECFMKIWHHAADYAREHSAPMTWMTQIVRNRCLDWLRRPNLEQLVTEDDDPIGQYEDERPGPLQQLQALDEARALAQCLRKLEARTRELILLAYYQGESHNDLAKRLALPLGSVKSWVRRGLMQLRGCLST